MTPVLGSSLDREGESARGIDLMTVAEVAAALRTTPKAIYAMVDRRQLPGVVRFNRRVLVERRALLDFLRQSSTSSERPFR